MLTEGSAAFAQNYWEIIKESLQHRSRLLALGTFWDKAQEMEPAALVEGIGELTTRLHSLCQKEEKGESSLMDALRAYYERLREPNAEIVGTHLLDLNDRLGGGVRPSQLIIVAGRPGMGKSAFAMDLAENASKVGDVLVYSLEMSAEDFGERFARKYEAASLKEEGRARSEAMDKRLHLRTNAGRTIEDIVHDATAFKERNPELRMILLDHVGLVKPSSSQKNRSREQEVAHVSRTLKVLAKDLEVPVVALSQLNRGVEHRNHKAPVLSDLRDSGSIEQDADIVLGLYRAQYYEPEAFEGFPDEVHILKSRQGKTGIVCARFIPERVTWTHGEKF
jgi:replicative DNA helicase